MRTSRKMSKKATITGGFLLAAACAAAVPAAAAHAGTRVTSVQAGTQVPGHTARPADNFNCKNGTVCIYDQPPTNSTQPYNHWWLFGCHQLSNEYGQKWVFNNQYGGYTATLWTGKNCNGRRTAIAENHTWSGDITPINSISLDNN